MLFSADGAAPALARFLGRGEQLLRVAVRDDQLAFGVGQQDRVGDGVDDAVEQHPLLTESGLGQQLTAQQTRDLLAERAPDPQRLGIQFVADRPLDEQQPLARLLRVCAQRNGVERASLERDAIRAEVSMNTGPRLAIAWISGWLRVVAAERELHDGAARHAVFGDQQHLVRQRLDDEDGRFGDGRVRHQPVDGPPGRLLKIDARQQELEEGELRVRFDSRSGQHRRGRRGSQPLTLPLDLAAPSARARRLFVAASSARSAAFSAMTS